MKGGGEFYRFHLICEARIKFQQRKQIRELISNPINGACTGVFSRSSMARAMYAQSMDETSKVNPMTKIKQSCATASYGRTGVGVRSAHATYVRYVLHPPMDVVGSFWQVCAPRARWTQVPPIRPVQFSPNHFSPAFHVRIWARWFFSWVPRPASR